MKKTNILISIFLIIFGILIFFYPNIKEYRNNQEVQNLIKTFKDLYFESISDSKTNTSEESLIVSSETYISSDIYFNDLYEEMLAYNQTLYKTGQDIRDAFSYEESPVEISNLNTDSLIGYIQIPSIDCTLSLYIGASAFNLAKGAAVMGNTSMPIGGDNTNCVIAGHRGYRGIAYFRNITSIKKGDLVYMTNPWETLIYQAVSAEIAEPYNLEPLEIEEGKDLVTLISCHPYVIGGGSQRYIVKCERVGTLLKGYVAEEITKTVINVSSIKSQDVTSVYEESEDNLLTEDENLIENDDLMWIETALRILLPALLGVFVIVLLVPKKEKKNATHKKSQ